MSMVLGDTLVLPSSANPRFPAGYSHGGGREGGGSRIQSNHPGVPPRLSEGYWGSIQSDFKNTAKPCCCFCCWTFQGRVPGYFHRGPTGPIDTPRSPQVPLHPPPSPPSSHRGPKGTGQIGRTACRG